MPDYTGRADELLKEIEAIANLIPEEGQKKMREAVAAYMAVRKSCLDDLLKLLEDESAGTKTADAWKSRCDSARSSLADPIENALKNVTLPTDAAAAGYGWQMSTKVKEEQFFSTLSSINAAAVRDYMATNLQSLKDYTATLDEKWKKITSEEDKLQSEEQKLYKEMESMTQEIIREFTETERTVYEKSRQAAQVILTGASKAGDITVAAAEKLVELVTGVSVKIPEEAGKLSEKVAEELAKRNEEWLKDNAFIRGRLANYQALVQAERGGILPLFKETRRQVSEYWEKNGVEPAKRMIEGGKSSLESWLSGLATSAQKDDAKRFYDAAYAELQERFKSVETAASDFEKKWNGIFKGALSSSVADDLIDTSAWRMNAKTLAEIGTPDLVDALIKKMDGYYEESFEEPLEKLREAVGKFPEEHRANAERAVDEVKKSIETSVRDRIKALQRQVGESLNWFKPAELEKAFSREELMDVIE